MIQDRSTLSFSRTLTGLFAPLLTTALLFSACSTDDRTRLVVYSPHGKEMLSAYEDAFEAAHPEVNVQWIDMGGQDAYDRIRTERSNPTASIWWGGDGPTFSRAAREGLLDPYEPTWSAAMPDEAHGADHTWYATY